MDALESAKGKPGADAGKSAKQVAGVNEDGKMSKKALAKLQKKEAKKDKKAAGGAAADNAAPKEAKGKKPANQPQ